MDELHQHLDTLDMLLEIDERMTWYPEKREEFQRINDQLHEYPRSTTFWWDPNIYIEY